MSRKYFTVFKGDTAYDADKHKIYCWGEQCLTINPDKNTKVTTRGSRKIANSPLIYCGNELLANGKRYWIREAKKQNA
jgi:hypothetical protein